MNTLRKTYKTYSRAFKLDAIRLANESDRSISDIACELGIRRNQIYKWREQLKEHGEKAFSGRGRPKKEDQSVTALLRAENAQLREEIEILKKIPVFFANGQV